MTGAYRKVVQKTVDNKLRQPLDVIALDMITAQHGASRPLHRLPVPQSRLTPGGKEAVGRAVKEADHRHENFAKSKRECVPLQSLAHMPRC